MRKRRKSHLSVISMDKGYTSKIIHEMLDKHGKMYNNNNNNNNNNNSNKNKTVILKKSSNNNN